MFDRLHVLTGGGTEDRPAEERSAAEFVGWLCDVLAFYRGSPTSDRAQDVTGSRPKLDQQSFAYQIHEENFETKGRILHPLKEEEEGKESRPGRPSSKREGKEHRGENKPHTGTRSCSNRPCGC